MARIKGAQNRRTRTTKLFKRASGFHLGRGNQRRQATEAVLKARAYAYRGRKEKKRQYRALWIQRISAALMQHDLSYSRFIFGLKTAGIDMNRKQLSELAIHDAAAFGKVVEAARAALA